MFHFVAKPFLATGETSGSAASTASESGETSGPEQIVEALASTIVRFERLIENRSDEELHQPAQDGRWGIVEILSHLEDWERVFHDRVARILGEDRPELETYDDSLWAIEHDYGSQDGHAVFARFVDLRHALISQLRELGEDAWERTGVLADEGETTLRGLLQWLTEHDVRHFGQARDVFG